MNRINKNYFSLYHLKSFFLCMFSLLIIWFSLRAFSKVRIKDRPYLLTNIFEKKQLDTFKKDNKSVHVGLHITNFEEFDVQKNRFVMGGVVWFIFDERNVDQKILENFSFDRGKIETRSKAKKILLDNHKVFLQYEVLLRLKTNLHYRDFPFEDHRLSIALINVFFTPDQINFYAEPASFTISKNLQIAGWQPHKRDIASGYDRIFFDEKDKRKQYTYPAVVFSFEFIRQSFRHVEIVFLPLFLLLLIVLLSFLLSITKTGERMTYVLTALTAMLIYRFVIAEHTPQVGYFTITDKVFIIVLVSCFLTLAVQSWISTRIFYIKKRENSEHEEHRLQVCNDAIFYIFIVVLAVLIGLVFFY